MKKEARNYLREKYLTRVINLTEDIKMRMSIDSDNILSSDNMWRGERSHMIFESIESVLDKSRNISPSLRYSIGCHVKSKTFFKGDILQSFQPILKIWYLNTGIRTKFKPIFTIAPAMATYIKRLFLPIAIKVEP